MFQMPRFSKIKYKFSVILIKMPIDFIIIGKCIMSFKHYSEEPRIVTTFPKDKK
jgi:hypothetical protein